MSKSTEGTITNIIDNNATLQMMVGVGMALDLIRPTYGGNGKNVIVESKLYPYHMVVNDAQSIVQAIHTKYKGHKIGLDFIKELCDRADKVSGDARKTTCIILEEILKEGYKSELPKLELKRQLDLYIPLIESEIDLVTKNITLDEVYGVAKTASESEETGKLLQEIYQKIGKNGILTIEGSKTYETSYKITNGVRFEMTGMLSPEMVHDDEAKKDKRKETKAVYENPYILVTKKKITSEDDINGLLKEISEQENKSLVIFTQDMDSNVASMLVGLHKRGGFTDKFGNFRPLNVLIIKAPVLWQAYVFEDFSRCTNATIVEDKTGINFKNLQLKHLGTCGRIEVDSEDTLLTGIADITDHLQYLSEKGDDDSLLRLSWLATKSATLKLGSNSHTDLSYKRLKANDANRSTYLALQYGVVEGGGLCLYKIAEVFEGSPTGDIIKKALQAPLIQAMSNYGLDYDSYNQIIGDDIVDSSMVLKRAVRNAIGIASTLLTSSAIVYIPDKTADEMAYDIAIKQASPFNQYD